jgi:hypothetical protein
MLLIGCFAAIPLQAQNLEAGKSPSQIFAGTCNACHKSPRGLLKTVPAGSLASYLRQHYTTSSEMASLLSGFLVSNGATDTRYVGTQPRQAKDVAARPGGSPDHIDRFGRRSHAAAPSQEAAKPDAEPPQAAKPDADGSSPQTDPGRKGRNAKRLARPGEAPDTARPAVDGQAPAQAAIERGPDGRIARQKLGRRGKPGGEEPPPKEQLPTPDADKPDLAKGQPPRGEAAKEDGSKTEAAKAEGGRPENTTPTAEGKPEAARLDGPKDTGSETPALRADPVPPVTPAPSAAVSSGTPEPPPAPPETAAPAAPPEPTASAPPVAPAGPPAPPISQ